MAELRLPSANVTYFRNIVEVEFNREYSNIRFRSKTIRNESRSVRTLITTSGSRLQLVVVAGCTAVEVTFENYHCRWSQKHFTLMEELLADVARGTTWP